MSQATPLRRALRKVAHAIALAVLAFPMGAIGMWVVDRQPPTAVLRVEPTQSTSPGGVIEIRYFVRRIRSCAITIDRVLYDSKGVRFPLEDRSFVAAPGPLGDDSYIVAVQLPETFSPGRGRYRATSVYRCNPLHGWFPIVVTNPDITFDVVAFQKQQSGSRLQNEIAAQ
jgi:hypothetical protein